MFYSIDEKYSFMELFNPENGFYVRSGVIKEGRDTEEDPFMRSFPNLIDIGIMGSCKHGASGLCIKAGVECYQSGLKIHQPNMLLSDYKRIIDECRQRVYQVALGGRGDPDQHENFEDILKYTRENNIIPNFTSSGLGFTERTVAMCKEFCGAVAISWYRQEHTLRAIEMLLRARVTTNIHYVLGNNTIDEAIQRLKQQSFPDVNAIIFLLHKPVGLGSGKNVLSVDDPRVREFFELIDQGSYPWLIGFDSCSVPGILKFCANISKNSIDTCEGARWSMYITPDLKALPCSFDQGHRWAVDLRDKTIEEAWYSEQFEDFRSRFQNACPGCANKKECYGGCPIIKQVVLCDSEARSWT